MNCLLITLFSKTVAGIVQASSKSWNQLLYSRVIDVRHLPFEPRHDFVFAPRHRRRTSFGKFTAPHRHILPIHNVTINRNNLFVNLRWTFTFCIEKSHDGTHLSPWIGAAISNTSHSNKAGSTTAKRAPFTGEGSTSTAVFAIISIKMFLSAYTWCIFTFRTRLICDVNIWRQNVTWWHPHVLSL